MKLKSLLSSKKINVLLILIVIIPSLGYSISVPLLTYENGYDIYFVDEGTPLDFDARPPWDAKQTYEATIIIETRNNTEIVFRIITIEHYLPDFTYITLGYSGYPSTFERTFSYFRNIDIEDFSNNYADFTLRIEAKHTALVAISISINVVSIVLAGLTLLYVFLLIWKKKATQGMKQFVRILRFILFEKTSAKLLLIFCILFPSIGYGIAFPLDYRHEKTNFYDPEDPPILGPALPWYGNVHRYIKIEIKVLQGYSASYEYRCEDSWGYIQIGLGSQSHFIKTFKNLEYIHRNSYGGGPFEFIVTVTAYRVYFLPITLSTSGLIAIAAVSLGFVLRRNWPKAQKELWF